MSTTHGEGGGGDGDAEGGGGVGDAEGGGGDGDAEGGGGEGDGERSGGGVGDDEGGGGVGDAEGGGGVGEDEGGGGVGFSQIEGLIMIEFGTHSPPSAHVCSGQQVEPSTGNFGWHVASSGGKKPPRQEGTQMRPLAGPPQVPTQFGLQTVPIIDLVKVRARGRIGALG